VQETTRTSLDYMVEDSPQIHCT